MALAGSEDRAACAERWVLLFLVPRLYTNDSQVTGVLHPSKTQSHETHYHFNSFVCPRSRFAGRPHVWSP